LSDEPVELRFQILARRQAMAISNEAAGSKHRRRRRGSD
jgi:hypothetical protein